MPIIATANEKKDYTPAPEGVHQAVCVDVIDLGLLESSFVDDKGHKKLQHKINVVWQISDTRDDGKRFLLFKRYTLSLNEKASLRKDLESWRGKPFTRDEEMGFDVETVIGVNGLVNVQHRKSVDGTKTYANVVSVMPLIKGMPKLQPLDYVRPTPQGSEPEFNAGAAAQAMAEALASASPIVEELTDDDIPF